MRRVQEYRDTIAVVAGLLAPLAIAAAIVPFRGTFAGTASALVLVAVVVAVAANGSRMAGFVAAVSASLWFDFFLTRPYERFAMSHRPDIETAVSLFVVGIAVTELSARNRHHHRVAIEESDHIGLICYLSELVAEGAPAEQVIEQASGELTDLLNLRSCRFEAGASDHRVAQLEHDGNVQLGAIRWGVHQMGLPVAGAEPRQLGRPLRPRADTRMASFSSKARRRRRDRGSSRSIARCARSLRLTRSDSEVMSLQALEDRRSF